jgi:YVTN family beta-propeller protein
MPKAKHLIHIIIGLAVSLPLPASDRSSSIAINADGQTLAVVNNDSRSVSLVSLPGEDKAAGIFVGRLPQTAAFHPDGTRIYVDNWLDDTVSVIDLAEIRETGLILVCDEPYGTVIAPDGRVFVSCTGAGQVTVIDSATGAIVESIDTEDHPRRPAIAPDASELHVTHFTTLQVVRSLTARQAWSMATWV